MKEERKGNEKQKEKKRERSGEKSENNLVARGREADGGDHLGSGCPRGHMGLHVGLGDEPDAQPLVEAAREEEEVVLGVEVHRGDEVGVREHVQTVRAGNMPQPHLGFFFFFFLVKKNKKA